jgi:hypothetical protein
MKGLQAPARSRDHLRHKSGGDRAGATKLLLQRAQDLFVVPIE